MALLVAVPAFVLAGCGGSSTPTTPAPTSTNTAPVASTRPAVTPLAPETDVKVTECKADPKGTMVAAEVKNSTQKALNYVAAVEILVDGAKQDGVALLATNVKPGATAKTSATGMKTDIKGAVTCKVASVQAMAAG